MSVANKQYTEEEIKLIKNAAKIELSRRSFFYFCNTLADDFYLENRKYLKILCNTLQALYEERIIKIILSSYKACKVYMKKELLKLFQALNGELSGKKR